MPATIDLTEQLPASLRPPTFPTPGVLAIAGSDCSGGAGVEADMKTITACGCYAMTCITAITAQNSKGVHAVCPTSEETVRKVLNCLKDDDLNLKAVKVGLLPGTSIQPMEAYLGELASKGFENVVLDPVFVANSGDSFGDSQAPALISMFKDCRLVTPNFAETEIIRSYLLGHDKLEHITITSIDTLCKSAAFIGQRSHTSVLLKGGHIPFNAEGTKVDLADPVLLYNILYDVIDDTTTIFRSYYVKSGNTHGTGCTMSSYIASSLAKGLSLQEAVKRAIEFVGEAIRRSFPKKNGPVNHIWQLRAKEDPINALHSLVSDPELGVLWEKFTSHGFFQCLNNGTLSDTGLRHFLVQDYTYLQVFLACHKRLLQMATTDESKAVMANATRAVETEYAGHMKLLREKYGIVDPETIKPSAALAKYVDFMERLRTGNSFVYLETALIPCQFGFNHAVSKFYKPSAKYDTETGQTVMGDSSLAEPCRSLYEYWLQDAVSPQYQRVCYSLQKVYNHAYNADGGVDKKHVREIFKIGCELEYEFWDECYKA
ncbi:hypothetical protein FOA43_001759 [Brettanomyces nanus]|uniref:Phosphomethylpyrimidine kinase n=1 Tax=Eeniella nana TaxID=13502 RepID=A0A875RP19_EENNA|nr:uncharacterized protein FOA43_001759 [Brettanomyces nanus]QPG74430.1 hypothetical protein FOA43_001759 [Brettanomyces nanus]